MLAAIAYDCAAGTTTLTGWPAGWTVISENLHNTGACASVLYYKICDGAETSPMTLTTSTSEQSVHRVWRFNAGTHNASIAPERAYSFLDAQVSPNPPSLSPTGGSKDYFWISWVMVNQGVSVGTADVDTWPTGYSQTGGDISLAGASGAIAMGWAEKTATAASDDPSAFHLDCDPTAEACGSWTVAIHPAGAAALDPIRLIWRM
jgi:hypothetical protein